MQDIVAAAVRLDTGQERFFLTWGRLQSNVDPEPLAALVLSFSKVCALGGHPITARLCGTLQEAVKQPYFYECFFEMCQERIPPGSGYQKWARRKRKRMARGGAIYYLGQPDDEPLPDGVSVPESLTGG